MFFVCRDFPYRVCLGQPAADSGLTLHPSCWSRFWLFLVASWGCSLVFRCQACSFFSRGDLRSAQHPVDLFPWLPLFALDGLAFGISRRSTFLPWEVLLISGVFVSGWRGVYFWQWLPDRLFAVRISKRVKAARSPIPYPLS